MSYSERNMTETTSLGDDVRTFEPGPIQSLTALTSVPATTWTQDSPTTGTTWVNNPTTTGATLTSTTVYTDNTGPSPSFLGSIKYNSYNGLDQITLFEIIELFLKCIQKGVTPDILFDTMMESRIAGILDAGQFISKMKSFINEKEVPFDEIEDDIIKEVLNTKPKKIEFANINPEPPNGIGIFAPWYEPSFEPIEPNRDLTPYQPITNPNEWDITTTTSNTTIVTPNLIDTLVGGTSGWGSPYPTGYTINGTIS